MRTRVINIVGHTAGWAFFFSLVIGFFANSPGGYKNRLSQIFSGPFIIFYCTFLLLFYLNYFVLIPQLYLKSQYILYFFILLLLFAAVYFIKPFDDLMHLHSSAGQMPGPPNGIGDRPPGPGKGVGRLDITSIILFVTVWSLSTAIPIIRQWRVTEKKVLKAEADRANAELSFLKSQVNPHFLFNTLNNIYSMAVTSNENTAPSIMKLSNIMRYVTDEASQDFVSLEDEVGCVRDYIDLQKMRLGQNMQVDFSVIGNTTDRKIAPLMLMTFIENVFKYGISSHADSAIAIRLSVDQHNITFFCQNKLFDTKRNTERTGTGISNARQRLQHLYPKKHFLDISEEKGLFTVQLTLQA